MILGTFQSALNILYQQIDKNLQQENIKDEDSYFPSKSSYDKDIK